MQSSKLSARWAWTEGTAAWLSWVGNRGGWKPLHTITGDIPVAGLVKEWRPYYIRGITSKKHRTMTERYIFHNLRITNLRILLIISVVTEQLSTEPILMQANTSKFKRNQYCTAEKSHTCTVIIITFLFHCSPKLHLWSNYKFRHIILSTLKVTLHIWQNHWPLHEAGLFYDIQFLFFGSKIYIESNYYPKCTVLKYWVPVLLLSPIKFSYLFQLMVYNVILTL